ncbi:hypothetical protein C0J52_24742 [Blattella germanica]|nr:hypothetical protein C0J52_24742 [Blattella germanica]
MKALWIDLNYKEEQFSRNEMENVRKTEIRLSWQYLQLGELLSEDEYIKSECVLTAFSLNPVIPIYQKVLEVADQRGHTSERAKHGDISSLYLINGKKPMKSPNYDTMQAPSRILDSPMTDLPSKLRGDLSILINSPRIHFWFDWILDWEELKQNCEMYMRDPERMRNSKKELYFSRIEYDPKKRSVQRRMILRIQSGIATKVLRKSPEQEKLKKKILKQRMKTMKIKCQVMKKYRRLREYLARKAKCVEMTNKSGRYFYHLLFYASLNPRLTLELTNHPHSTSEYKHIFTYYPF